METFDDSLAPRFSQLLAQHAAELRAILRATGDLGDEASEAERREVMDFKDAATEASLATVDEAKAKHAAQELEQVLAAHRRLEGHSYGLCLDCGEAIDLRRLMALPATPFCTSCQAIHEHERPLALRR